MELTNESSTAETNSSAESSDNFAVYPPMVTWR